MKFIVRTNTFETNSSSTHALAIDVENPYDLSVLSGIKEVYPVTNTGYPLIFETPQERLNYIWTMWLDRYYDFETNPESKENLDEAEKQIKEILELPDDVEFIREEADIESIFQGGFFLRQYDTEPNLLRYFVCSPDSFVQVGGGEKPAPVIKDMMRWERDELGIEFPEYPDTSSGFYHEYKNLDVVFYGNE